MATPTSAASVTPADALPVFISFTEFIVKEISRNSLPAYLIAGATAVIGVTLLLLLRGVISRALTKRLSRIDRHGRVNNVMAVKATDSFLSILPWLPVYFALKSLSFSTKLNSAIDIIFLWVLTFLVVRFIADLSTFLLDVIFRSSAQDSLSTPSDKNGAGPLKPIIRMVVWCLGIVFLLDNLGFQISSIVAGLGIIGVAVGLAGQAILADFFSYLVIIMDKPFTIGDTISYAGITGKVEHIGLKTTRVRTESGELIVCPNGELTKQSVSNFHRAQERQRVIKFGVAYETPLHLLRKIPAMVREEAADLPVAVNIERVHFTEFGDSSLNFELLLSVSGNAYSSLLDGIQAFNLALIARFTKERIEFAYPTRTLHLAQPHAGESPLLAITSPALVGRSTDESS